MALSLLCGGLGVASAADVTVHVDASLTPSTATEVYTTTGVNTLLDGKADKTALATKANATDVAKNTENIATNQGNIKKLEDDKLSKDVASATYATNKALNDLEKAVTNKVDESVVEEALDGKANTDLSNLTEAGKSAIKNTMSEGMNLKADKTYVDTEVGKKANKATTLTGYGITDAYTKDATDTAITTKVNEEKDARELKDTELSGRIDTLSTTVDSKVSKTDLNTTLGNYYTQAETNAAIKTAVDDEKNARDTAIKGEVTERNKAISDAIALEVTNRDAAITKAKTELQGKITAEETARKEEDAKLEGKITENTTAINNEKAEREAADADLSKRIGTVTEDGEYIKKSATNNVSENLKVLDTKAKTNADNIQTNANNIKNNKDEIARVNGELVKTNDYFNKELGKTNDYFNKELGKTNDHFNTELGNTNAALQATNKRTAGIGRTDTGVEAGNQTVIEGKVYFDQNGNVSGVKDLQTDTIHATGGITSEGLDARAGEIKTTGKVSAGDVSTGTLETTGNAKIGGDLTINGKLNVGEIYMEHKKLDSTGPNYDSATSITADGISNRAKVTDKNGNTTESQFTHNEKGTFNYAKDKKSTGEWKGATSNVTADGVSNTMTDSDKNKHTYHQTATESKEQLVNGDKSKSNFEKKTAEGNTISIKDKDADGKDKSLTNKQTADGEKTSVTNKDSSSTINQGADQIRYNVTSKDENKTSSSIEVKADGITNTSKDGTITNDAKDIVNNASGNISNKSQTMDTTVTGKATESYGSLDTTVNGNETHIVKGTKTETVDGKVTENYKAGQATNVTGDQDITVSGTQTTTATDINRNASSGMIDTIDNDYGTNTETKVAGETKTEVSIKGTDEKGEYIRGATQSRDYLIKGTLKNSETKTAEATSSEVTDGTNKASTIQDAKNLAGSVTNGTETGISGIHAKDGSVSIDSLVTGGGMSSVINQKKDSITSAVGDGTNSTVILQDKDNVTIASSNGTVAIGGKDIVSNAQDTITNTAGTKITDTAGDSSVVTEKGKGTTFTKTGSTTYSTEADAPTDTNIAGNLITTGRVDANELKVSDKDDHGNTADFSVEAGEGVKASAGNGTTKGSLDVTADEVKTEVKDDLTGNSTNTSQTADGIKGSATDKDGNKTYTKVTATENSFQVQDKDGNIKNHQVNTKDKSENTITNGDKTNTVTSTADGTTFTNSKANTAFEGGTYTDTTIKGNTITTGKVTMDYADVMKDLGVHGNANIAGKTTTGSLEVKGESKLTGDVIMENNATVKKDLTVEGNTTTETLNVTKNAEVGGELKVAKKATFEDSVSIAKDLSVGGDVTANSYKVGDKTYISADGINANDQKITNVADGSISEGSKDAVNGGQLYGMKTDLEHKVDKVGANAAAMANLHPMEFDPDSKWNIAAAMGNYGSETATAIGAFYRPNEDVMVNFSTAFGTGENMVGGGVSVRLGKGSNKLSREETNALKAQVNDLTARMDALLSVLNPNMSKDFPDVPENHWAYEAVSRLAGNDIVQGYPDGEFHGERTMTRYEMAEIIYNALSRGAEAEKELVEEFKPELQAMAASEKATAERAEG